MLKRIRESGRVGTIARVLIWAAVGVLLATPKSRPWPVEVNVQADSDTTVVVTWYSQEERIGFCESPPPDPYDSFELFFEPVGESSWTSVGRTRDTFMVHDPQHRVGRYSVRGWRRDEVKWDTWTDAPTVPRHIGPFRLHEASTGDTSALGFGYQWGRGGYVYVMDTSTIWSDPDAYVTDYQVGASGPLLIASPSLVLGDSGVRVGGTYGWRTTWFSAPLPDEQSLLPRWDPLAWAQVCSLPYTPLLVACRREGGNYALIKVLSMNATSIELEAWYQQINGLRLAGH